MSVKTRLAKLEAEKSKAKKSGGICPEEAAIIKNISQCMNAYRGKIPMTDDLQARIDKMNKEKPMPTTRDGTWEEFISIYMDAPHVFSRGDDYPGLIPFKAKFENGTLHRCDVWDLLDALY